MGAKRSLIAVLSVVALAAGACGGDDDDDAATDAADTTDDASADTDDTSGGDAEGEDAAPEDAAELVTIRMGWGFPVEEINYVMQMAPEQAPNLGTCYEVEWERFNGTAPQLQATAAGTVDGGTFGALSALTAVEQGADIVLTGEIFSEVEEGFSVNWVAPAGTTLADLDGATIGSNAIGGSIDYIVAAYLESEAGLVVGEDVQFAEVPFPQMADALLAGQVDLAPLPVPFYLQVAENPDYETLFEDRDVIMPFPTLLQGFSRSFVEEHPEAVGCFVEDMVGIAGWVNDPANRDEVIALTAELNEIPAEALEPYLLTDQDFVRTADYAVDVEALQASWDFFAERGAAEGGIPAADLIVEGISVTADGS
ncbi:MAG: ABC transporter substrate-binding protein [Actinomycetota bacterium]|nr:ABC transporter substrate-binding protein [Actinomycetota bacterium]